jgi:hypothetical protein
MRRILSNLADMDKGDAIYEALSKRYNNPEADPIVNKSPVHQLPLFVG